MVGGLEFHPSCVKATALFATRTLTPPLPPMSKLPDLFGPPVRSPLKLQTPIHDPSKAITMLKLYHHTLSPNSRRVWIALLEKEVPFELIALNLDGDQFHPDFLKISPFHHIPVLVDGDFSLIESVAILDYLEATHPIPSLMPVDVREMARARMVQMVTLNELLPAMRPLIGQMMGIGSYEASTLDKAKQQTTVVLNLFEQILTGQDYFGGQYLCLADIVVGVSLPWLPQAGLPLDPHPNLMGWCDRIQARPSWQATAPSLEAMDAFRTRMMARAREH